MHRQYWWKVLHAVSGIMFLGLMALVLIAATVPVPTFTSEQKLAIRSAQVEAMNANTAFQNAPDYKKLVDDFQKNLQNLESYKELQKANQTLTNELLKDYKAVGVDPQKYTLDKDLNLVEVKADKK